MNFNCLFIANYIIESSRSIGQQVKTNEKQQPYH